MGYNLAIGELINDEIRYEKLDNAPAYGEPTDYTNQRWPSYTAWANFARFTNLYDFFFNRNDGLMNNHPGLVKLTEQHRREFNKIYKDFYLLHPECKAGYSPKVDEENRIFHDPEWPVENDYAVRLEWLHFWINWALDNCQNPHFYNS